MLNEMRSFTATSLKNHMVRYFIVASFVVGVELLIFAFINIALGVSYLIATPASMAVAIVLNWYFSKVFVFRGSRHKIHVEFGLILITSLLGLVIQLIVTAFFVQELHELPIVGKFFAIIVTFFWNFWIRKKYIFTV